MFAKRSLVRYCCFLPGFYVGKGLKVCCCRNWNSPLDFLLIVDRYDADYFDHILMCDSKNSIPLKFYWKICRATLLVKI